MKNWQTFDADAAKVRRICTEHLNPEPLAQEDEARIREAFAAVEDHCMANCRRIVATLGIDAHPRRWKQLREEAIGNAISRDIRARRAKLRGEVPE